MTDKQRKLDAVIGGYGSILIEYHRCDSIAGAFIRVSGPGGSVALRGQPLLALVAAVKLLGLGEPSIALEASIAAKLDWQLNGEIE